LEHRPLTDREIIERCCLNLTETYFALARNASGFRTYEDEGMVGCFANINHPATNFLVVARPSPHAIQRLRQIAEERSFMVYLLPTPEELSVIESLKRNDFEETNVLNLMFYRGGPGETRIELDKEVKPSQRLDLAFRLARLFFSDRSFSLEIAGLTAISKCELYSSKDGHCGCMVHEVADTLGLYNIAVAPDMRGRGIGSDLVRTLIAEAQLRKKTAVLQCHDSLVEWYERLGFRNYGQVHLLRSKPIP
jgi:ribosomal protein S18 acetylase RimI-like enzyme